MASDWEDARPDILALGKSMSGGSVPASGVVCDAFIMDHVGPGEHGSTYGGNPLAMACSRAAVQVLLDELLDENAMKMGGLLLSELKKIKSPIIKEVRGRGLFIGVEVIESAHINGNHLAKLLKARGLLSKATHDYTIRLTPPLVINEAQIMEAVDIIKLGIKDLEKMNHDYAQKKH